MFQYLSFIPMVSAYWSNRLIMIIYQYCVMFITPTDQLCVRINGISIIDDCMLHLKPFKGVLLVSLM